MELEGSLLYSQEPTAESHPDPAECSPPYTLNLFILNPFEYYPIYVRQLVLSLQVLTKIFISHLTMHAMCSAHFILLI